MSTQKNSKKIDQCERIKNNKKLLKNFFVQADKSESDNSEEEDKTDEIKQCIKTLKADITKLDRKIKSGIKYFIKHEKSVDAQGKLVLQMNLLELDKLKVSFETRLEGLQERLNQ